MVAEDSARPFDLIKRPLRSWLDWNGSDDEIREDEILQGRIGQREKRAAAEHKANYTLLLLREAQRLHVHTIEQMFRNTEVALQDLLDAVGRDRVALRALPADEYSSWTSQATTWTRRTSGGYRRR
jgi:hypothetical protein